MSKRIYIAGPMTGYPEFNFPAFYAAAAEFEAMGWIVANPADKDSEKTLSGFETGDAKAAVKGGFNFREAYLWDCEKVINGDAIYMLKGWQKSVGAVGEHAVATAVKRHYPDYQIMYQDAAEKEETYAQAAE